MKKSDLNKIPGYFYDYITDFFKSYRYIGKVLDRAIYSIYEEILKDPNYAINNRFASNNTYGWSNPDYRISIQRRNIIIFLYKSQKEFVIENKIYERKHKKEKLNTLRRSTRRFPKISI